MNLHTFYGSLGAFHSARPIPTAVESRHLSTGQTGSDSLAPKRPRASRVGTCTQDKTCDHCTVQVLLSSLSVPVIWFRCVAAKNGCSRVGLVLGHRDDALQCNVL